MAADTPPGLRVLHVASHQVNVGDGALNAVIQDRIRSASGRPVTFVQRDVVEFVDDSPLALADLESFDLVVVGGGGAIDGHPHHDRSGMAVPITGAEVRSSRVPIAFVALGHNLFPGQPFHHGEALAEVIAACKERGFLFSVRNDGSAERLRRDLGAAADGAVEVPDPGFFVRTEEGHVPAAWSGHRPLVLLQLAGDNLDRRLGRSRRRRGRSPVTRFVTEMRRLVELLVDAGAEVVLTPHIIRDVELHSQVAAQLGTSPRRRRVWVQAVSPPARAAEFFRLYEVADVVVGMRGHSVICATGLGTPCVALSTHEKVAGFMQACDLAEWTYAPEPGIADRLADATLALLADSREHDDRRTAATSMFSDRFDDAIRTAVSSSRG